MKQRNKNSKNINLIDRVCLSASQVADQLSLNPTKKGQLWESISSKLGEMDKRIMTWLFAMATSVSLLIAGSMNFIQIEIPFQNKHDMVMEGKIAHTHTITPPQPKAPMKVVVLEKITPKEIETIQATAWEDESLTIQRQIPNTPGQAKSSEETTGNPPFFPSKPELFGSLLFNQNGLSPELGISLPILKIDQIDRVHTFKAGISTQITYTNSSSNEVEQIGSGYITPVPSVFANLEYESQKKSGGYGWNARIGYKLNQDSSGVYQANTMKATIQKSINPHIKIGPEVIFTHNFRKIYPGIALVVS
ncbi:hypothetical protein BFP72_07035 [Reichenbachiella sp. 5M10]|uniref:hypothetical protein n=1 Tax=Reichenbachiella sp. 5M10 TaxID=1889772 RepID=UPI000C159868|nr:hypothetical protein [Reichenbachiella sp. 5M10]PIB35168.1 hypothetical protein BFP72_07035 [Reichenbachiella sp. 5M10]